MLSYYKSGTVKETECTCAPCKQFWKNAFLAGADSITNFPWERAEQTAILGNQKGLVKKGDRVLVDGKQSGVVQYVGLADDHLISPEMHVGVSLYDNLYSTHNGIYKGKRFFHCSRGHGAMVKYSQITPLAPIPRTREVSGNLMFPSYDAVIKRRKEREKKIKDAEERLKKEHDLKRRAQMERFSKSAPIISPRHTRASKLRTEPLHDKPNQPLQDEHDIAFQDFLERERRKELNKPQDPKAREEMRFHKMKAAFGGDEKGERMAETLRKLHQGYEEGKVIAMAERE